MISFLLSHTIHNVYYIKSVLNVCTLHIKTIDTYRREISQFNLVIQYVRDIVSNNNSILNLIN